MNIDNYFIDKDNLPEPLSKEETYRLIEEGSNEAREKLITHNIRLVLYLVTHVYDNIFYNKKDLVSICIIGLIKAVDTYDISKGFEFSTYVKKCIKNEVLMLLREIKKNQKVTSLNTIIFNKDNSETTLEDTLSIDLDIVKDYEKIEIMNSLRELVEQLPNQKKEIIKLYFGFYNNRIYTQKEIALMFNISQPRVSRTINKVLKKLRKELESQDRLQLSESEILGEKNISNKLQMKIGA